MLNEALFHISLNDLKDIVLQDLTIFNLALSYVLLYVIYKALGRYIYFKPQEHASKVNRTFLLLSLLIVLLSSLGIVAEIIPVKTEYKWFFTLCGLVLLIAPLAIITAKLIVDFDLYGDGYVKYARYLPVERDYFKTAVTKSLQTSNSRESWEEENVKSTGRNIPSDALMNFGAGIVFTSTIIKWIYESFLTLGWHSLVFTVVTVVAIIMIYFDRSVFSWIKYISLKKDLYSLDRKVFTYCEELLKRLRK